MKGYHLLIEGIRKGYLFLSKKVYKRVRGWTSGWSLPYKTSLLSTSTIPTGMILNGTVACTDVRLSFWQVLIVVK